MEAKNSSNKPKSWSRDWSWGRLQDHYSDCTHCDGVGQWEDGEDCPHCEDGRVLWGSFYVDEEYYCALCGKTKPVAAMYEDAEICLGCWLVQHKELCGCAQWACAEQEVLGESNESKRRQSKWF